MTAPLLSGSTPEERQGRLRSRAIRRGVGKSVFWGLLGALLLASVPLGWVHGPNVLLSEIAGGCFLVVTSIEVLQLRWRLDTGRSGRPWQEYWGEVQTAMRGAYPWLQEQQAAPVSVQFSQRAEQDWSTVHLKGFWEGRLWEISFLPSGTRGDFGAGFHASFRGAPPTQESERTLPYVYMAPHVPGSTPMGHKAQAFVLDRWLKGTAPAPVDLGPEGPRLLRGASYHPADRELASVWWTGAYLGWCRVGTAMPRRDRSWPTLVGVVPNLDLSFVLKPTTPPSGWVSLFQRFMEQADRIESIFESPPTSEVPVEFAILPRKDPHEPPGLFPLYTCPRCSKLARVKLVGPLGRAPGGSSNLATLCCEVRLFREMPPLR